MKVAEWPDIDRQLWKAGIEPDDGLGPSRHADRLSPASSANAKKAYGRFLAVLAENGRLDPSGRPAVRVTRSHAMLFVRALEARKNTHHSIYERMQSLLLALRIMEPASNFKWLTDRLDRLHIQRRDIVVFDSQDLEDWGHELMDEALAHADPTYRRVWFRNGLMIAIFATSAPRIRSLASMRLGRQIRRMESGAWELAFSEKDVKTGRPIEHPVRANLWSRIDRYVEVERAEALAGRTHDAFWVGKFGEKLELRAIEGMIRRASKAKFGVAFGTHRFRHSLATTAAYAAPSNPGLAAGALGISEKVLADHYNKARNHHAFLRLQETMKNARKEAERMSKNEQRYYKAYTAPPDPSVTTSLATDQSLLSDAEDQV